MNEGKLFNSQRITFVTNNTELFAGSGLEDLANEQIGIFAQDGRARFKGTTTPAHVPGRVFKIVQGFPKSYSALTSRAQLPTWNHGTTKFSAKQIVSWSARAAKKYTKEEIVALGYDGVDATKGLTVAKGKNIKIHLHLTGNPINKLIPSGIGWLHREYFIDTDCDVDPEPGANQGEIKLRDKIIAAIQADKYGTIPISNFVKVTGLSTGNEVPSGLVSYTTYQATVVDDGTNLALGLVQAQYPGIPVKRASRAGLLSVYELVKLGTDPAPTAISLNRFPVLPKCTSCPPSYTLQASGAVFVVTVSSTETSPDQAGQISKVLLSQSAEQKVYQYVMPAATVAATFTTAIKTALPDAEVVSDGIQQQLCIPPAAATSAWATGVTLKKASRDYLLTVGDTICGTDRLTEMNARYGGGVTVDTVGQCSRRYKITVTSDPVADETCGVEQYVFTSPAPFDGAVWVGQPVITPVQSVKAGILFEGARFERPVDHQTYPYVGYDRREQDCVHIRVSSFSHDYTGPVCQDPFPFTPIQDADFSVGYGQDVIANELDSLGYFMKGPYEVHPMIRKLYQDTFIAKPDEYYDEYLLGLSTRHMEAGFFGSKDYNVTYRFYFPVGQGKKFEAAINQLIASADTDLLPVVL